MSWWVRLCAALCCLDLVAGVVALFTRRPDWPLSATGVCVSAIGITAFMLLRRMGGEKR